MEVLALECTGVNKIDLIKFKKQEPSNDAILIKIGLCGICGTDIHGIQGKRSVKYPFIPGHEIVGTIEAMGKNASNSIKNINSNDKLKIGDRITINPRIVCGRCYYCQNLPQYQELCINAITATSIGSSKPPHLFGGWAEYMYILPGSEIIKLPEKLSDEIAVLIEPYACAVGCIGRHLGGYEWISSMTSSINETIVIYGVGAIGMLMLAGFYLAGAKQIIAVDANQKKLELAREFGASNTISVLSTTSDERIKKIKEITNGSGAAVVVEACGVPDAIAEGISVLRRRGRLYELGHLLNAGKVELDPNYICRNEIEIMGNYAYPSSQSMVDAAKLLGSHKLPYEKLIKIFNLDQYRDIVFNKKIGSTIKAVFRI